MSTTFFDRVYGTSAQDQMQAAYEDWADTYDADMTGNGYATATRCAAALAAHLDSRDAPVFDFACGTGLSGAALAAEGFSVIDGSDLSPEMLNVARSRGVYRRLWAVGPDEDPGITRGDYAAITAAAAISPGAAPARYLDTLITGLAPGGLIVFSYNDRAMADADYTGRLAAQIAGGAVRQLFAEEGEHIAGLGSRSVVYVLEKT